MATNEIRELALAAAKRPAAVPYNPFSRSSNLLTCDRETLIAATFRVYRGDAYDFFEPLPGEKNESAKTGEGRSRPGRIDINNLRHCVDTLSNTYCGDVQRTFYVDDKRVEADGDPVLDAVLTQYENAEINRVLEGVDAALNLGGNAVLRPIYDEEYSELVIHQYNAPMLRVVENTINPRRPVATVLTSTPAGDGMMDEALKGAKKQISEIWLRNEYILYVDGAVKESRKLEVEPPLVHCFNSVPSNLSRYWQPCFGPALAHIDRVLNNDIIGPLGYTAVMQGFAQAVIFGANEGAQKAIGPGRVFEFNGDPDRRQDFQFVSPNAPLLDVLEIIKQMLKMVQRSYGIPDALLDVKTDASGAAIVQANAPLAEMRERRGKVFRRIETDILRQTIRVLAGRDPRVPADIDPMRYDVSVRYADTGVSQSVQDKNEREKFLLETGILTPGDIAVQEFPDRWADAEEANEEIESRRAKMRDEMREEMDAQGLTKKENSGKPVDKPENKD